MSIENITMVECKNKLHIFVYENVQFYAGDTGTSVTASSSLSKTELLAFIVKLIKYYRKLK